MKNNINYKLGEHLFITGRTRSGKTYTAKKLIKKNLKSYIIFDKKGEDFNHMGFIVKNKKELIQALKNKKNQIVVTNEFMSKQELNEMLRVVYLCCKNIAVIVDEIHFFISKSKNLFWISQFVKVGASKKKSFWAISQRGQDIHNDILTQATHKLVGNISHEDKVYLSNKIGVSVKEIESLKQFEFYYLHDIAGETAKKIKL